MSATVLSCLDRDRLDLQRVVDYVEAVFQIGEVDILEQKLAMLVAWHGV